MSNEGQESAPESLAEAQTAEATPSGEATSAAVEGDARHEPSRAGLDDVSDDQARGEAEAEPGPFSVTALLRRHPVAVGLGAAALGAAATAAFAALRLRRSLPADALERAVRQSLRQFKR